jgi:hypothetical protein
MKAGTGEDSTYDPVSESMISENGEDAEVNNLIVNKESENFSDDMSIHMGNKKTVGSLTDDMNEKLVN